MPEKRPNSKKPAGLAQSLCLVTGVASLVGAYWGIGIVLGPAAFLLATYLSGKRGHSLSDAGGLLGLVGFAVSLGFAVPRLAAGPNVGSPWVGKEAPNFELVDIQGNTHSLLDYRGKRVFVMQWGLRCPPCIREIPHLISLVEELGPEEFQIVSVSSDPQMWLEDAVAKTGINYPVVSLANPENHWGEPYNLIEFLPTLLVVSPEGRFEEIIAGGLREMDLRKLARGERI